MAIKANKAKISSLKLKDYVLTSIDGESTKVSVDINKNIKNPVKIATISVDTDVYDLSAPTYKGNDTNISCDTETGIFSAIMTAFVQPSNKDFDFSELTLENCLSLLVESVGGKVINA